MNLVKITCDDCGEEYETPIRIGVPLTRYGPCLVCRKRQHDMSRLRYVVIGIVAASILSIMIAITAVCG